MRTAGEGNAFMGRIMKQSKLGYYTGHIGDRYLFAFKAVNQRRSPTKIWNNCYFISHFASFRKPCTNGCLHPLFTFLPFPSLGKFWKHWIADVISCNFILSGFLSFLAVICEAFHSVLENPGKFKLAGAI